MCFMLSIAHSYFIKLQTKPSEILPLPVSLDLGDIFWPLIQEMPTVLLYHKEVQDPTVKHQHPLSAET